MIKVAQKIAESGQQQQKVVRSANFIIDSPCISIDLNSSVYTLRSFFHECRRMIWGDIQPIYVVNKCLQIFSMAIQSNEKCLLLCIKFAVKAMCIVIGESAKAI